ncbi:MAG: sigma-70 family RNA polymerase sigma factor [Acidobacteriota bacterium]|nr:sigma-70 family RNA polymerase sigma factor [Acidobacteriota bacterium]
MDDHTFETNYKKYRRSVLFFFTKQGFSSEEANDLTQEVFLRVYKGRDRFRGEASFKTFVHRVAANLWKNQIREEQTIKRKGVVVPLDETNADRAADVSANPALSNLIHQERSSRMREAIEQFPEQMRNCMLLRIYHQLKYREIAATLKISVETVKTQLHLARERLGLELTESDP